MTIQELKKELGLSNSEMNKKVAEFFAMSYISYMNSSARQRYETALCKFYSFLREGEKEKKKNVRSEAD